MLIVVRKEVRGDVRGGGGREAGASKARLTLQLSLLEPLRFLFFSSSVNFRFFLGFLVETRCIFHIINWSRHPAILYNIQLPA